jgi:hypothetical protein
MHRMLDFDENSGDFGIKKMPKPIRSHVLPKDVFPLGRKFGKE